MDAKLAKAMEHAFGNSIAFVLAKWRGLVQDEKQKKMAMQRLVGLLAGCQLENLGVHVIHGWRDVVRQSQLGTSHLRKADNHRKYKTGFLLPCLKSCRAADAVRATGSGSRHGRVGQGLRRRRLHRGSRAGVGQARPIHVRRKGPRRGDDDGHAEKFVAGHRRRGCAVPSRAAAIAASGGPLTEPRAEEEDRAGSLIPTFGTTRLGRRATAAQRRRPRNLRRAAECHGAKGEGRRGVLRRVRGGYDRAGQKFCMQCGAKA